MWDQNLQMISTEFFVKATVRTFWKEMALPVTELLPREKGTATVNRTTHRTLEWQLFKALVTFSQSGWLKDFQDLEAERWG